MKSPTTGTLEKLYELVTGLKRNNFIMRSVRRRRFRDPQHPGNKLPTHGRDQITAQEKHALKRMISVVRDYLDSLEKHFKLK